MNTRRWSGLVTRWLLLCAVVAPVALMSAQDSLAQAASRPLKIGIIGIIGIIGTGDTRLLTAKQLREALGLPAK